MEHPEHNDPQKALRAHAELMALFAGHQIPREAVDDPVFRDFVSGERVEPDELWECLVHLKLQQCMPAIQQHDVLLVPTLGGGDKRVDPPVALPPHLRLDFAYRGTGSRLHDELAAFQSGGQTVRNIEIDALLPSQEDALKLFDGLAKTPPAGSITLTVRAGTRADKRTSKIVFTEVMQGVAKSGRIEGVNLWVSGFAALADTPATAAFSHMISCVSKLQLRLELGDLMAACRMLASSPSSKLRSLRLNATLHDDIAEWPAWIDEASAWDKDWHDRLKALADAPHCGLVKLTLAPPMMQACGFSVTQALHIFVAQHSLAWLDITGYDLSPGSLGDAVILACLARNRRQRVQAGAEALADTVLARYRGPRDLAAYLGLHIAKAAAKDSQTATTALLGATVASAASASAAWKRIVQDDQLATVVADAVWLYLQADCQRYRDRSRRGLPRPASESDSDTSSELASTGSSSSSSSDSDSDSDGPDAIHNLVSGGIALGLNVLKARLLRRVGPVATRAHAQVLAEIQASFRGLLALPARPLEAPRPDAGADPSALFAKRWLGPDYAVISPHLAKQVPEITSGAGLLFWNASGFMHSLELELHPYLCSIAPEVTDAAVRPLMVAIYETLIEAAFMPLIEELYCECMGLAWPLGGD